MSRFFRNTSKEHSGFLDCATVYGVVRFIIEPGETKELRDVAAIEKVSPNIVELDSNREEVSVNVSS